jgi:hypothetical protein
MAELATNSEKNNMLATSSCEVTMTPFTERGGINVHIHLPDIHHSLSHITVEGVKLNIEEENFSHD